MMGRKSLVVFILLLGVLALIPAGQAMAAAAPQVTGAWTCTVVRSGTIERPIIWTFSADGTFNYSSATTINSTIAGPVQNSGFHSRGGGRGQWTRVSNNVFNFKAIEFMYDANGDAAGSFSVDTTFLLTSGDQLCSGRPECPNQKASISLVKYVFDQNNPDLDIVGVQYLLPAGTAANTLCNRMSHGAGFPFLSTIPTP